MPTVNAREIKIGDTILYDGSRYLVTKIAVDLVYNYFYFDVEEYIIPRLSPIKYKICWFSDDTLEIL